LLLTLSLILTAGRDVNNVRANVLIPIDLNDVIIFINQVVVDLHEFHGKANNVESGAGEFLCQFHVTLTARTPHNLIEARQLIRDFACHVVNLLG
jgi:hypothetical protein